MVADVECSFVRGRGGSARQPLDRGHELAGAGMDDRGGVRVDDDRRALLGRSGERVLLGLVRVPADHERGRTVSAGLRGLLHRLSGLVPVQEHRELASSIYKACLL